MTNQGEQWNGEAEADDEPADAVFPIWVIEPDLTRRGYDEVWERSYQRMQELIHDNLEYWLDNYTEEELRDGISIKLRLRDVAKWEYEEATATD